MNKNLVIKCCKCLLVFDSESELFKGLKPEALKQALVRGKGYRRAAACEKRQAQVDRWQLYEWLKGNRIPEEAISLVESMGITELRAGVIDYLERKSREVNYG